MNKPLRQVADLASVEWASTQEQEYHRPNGQGTKQVDLCLRNQDQSTLLSVSYKYMHMHITQKNIKDKS